MLNSAQSPSPHATSASASLGTKRPYPADEPAQGNPQPIYPQRPPPQYSRGDGDGDGHSAPPLTSFSPPAMPPAKPPPGNSAASSSFRNVSACNRCRLRKNRCDQRLPRCQSCEKAGVRCVGYDPITKREIPRSYVYFLEARVAYLEKLLANNGIVFNVAGASEGEAGIESAGAAGTHSASSGNSPREDKDMDVTLSSVKKEKDKDDMALSDQARSRDTDTDGERDKKEADAKLDKLVSNIGMVSVQGASDSRFLGSTSGISFARIVFAAVKSSVPSNVVDRGTVRPTERLATGGTSAGTGSSMRDSFFGLQSKPTMKQAPFPDRDLAERLVHLYFEHANPQIPILHRVDFMELFDHVYSSDVKSRSAREMYILNIVFAIGAGIIFDSSDAHAGDEKKRNDRGESPTPTPNSKRQKLTGRQYQPEEYHASAIVHLETFLGSSPATDGFGGGLEELQAVLLLAGFALLRPVAPGLWYIVGVAVRLAIDLGLHYEDGTGIDSIGEVELIGNQVRRGSIVIDPDNPSKDGLKIDPKERGRREWVRDLRRRLWWCVYSFDRLVSTCVGRPFGITDQVITTEFPSLLDDRYITKTGFESPPSDDTPSYKHVGLHYFKLRLLQSEIQQVLQYQQANRARQIGKNRGNAFMHTKLPSPFLLKFGSFKAWRQDVHRRLAEWKHSAPTRRQTGVQFSIEFLELNYWQALIMLYRQCLAVPPPLAGELSPTNDVSSPSWASVEEDEDEDEIYVKVAEAGEQVLRIYRRLHHVRLVNYTYLATHHLFMAGISFLYAIWHSPVVRSRRKLDDVDFTILAGTSVLGDLMEKCPPAEACRDAFERMSKATVQMCLSTTGFGVQAESMLSQPRQRTPKAAREKRKSRNEQSRQGAQQTPKQPHSQVARAQLRAKPKFDMNLSDLFPEDHPNRFSPPQQQGASPLERQVWSPQQRADRDSSSSPTYPANNALMMQQAYNGSNPSSYGMTSQPQQMVSPQAQVPHHQHQQYFYSASPQSPASVASGPYNQPPYSEQQDFFSLSGLDFLDSTGDHAMDYASGANNMGMVMNSIPTFGQGGGNGTGLDLGFGMSDFQHDWSEGAGYDLFGGFFFGGGAPPGPGQEPGPSG